MTKKIRNFFRKFYLFPSCRRYHISLWQCPSFLFLMMGLIIIGVILVTYFVATLKIGDPKTVVLIVIGVTVLLLIIDYIISKSFERIFEANRMK